MKLFKDRQSAGKLLAKRLRQIYYDPKTIVLAIPRGGVVVAAEVAKQLKLPLDIIVTRKIGHPNQPELALGAVDPDGEVVWDQELLNQLKLKIDEEMQELKRRENIYRKGKEPLNLENTTVILVDDGIATGATVLAAISFLKRHGADRIILATPLASKEAVSKISQQIKDLIILEIPDYFQAVGQFYHQFLPVSDSEVVQYLKNGR